MGKYGVLVHNQYSNELRDDAKVVRGGTCSAERFQQRSEIIPQNLDGLVHNVSVNCANDKSIEELAKGIPNGQIGTTTLGEIRCYGGDVVSSPSPGGRNDYHCLLNGITCKVAEQLFNPTKRNPLK